MSVKLRFMRVGKKNRPYYRLCAMDSRSPRDGAYLESIGFYDPLITDDQKKIRINKERAEYWLSVGAQPSETVASFLRKAMVQGLFKAKKPRKRRKSKTKKVQAGAPHVASAAKPGKKPKPPKKKKEPKDKA